MTRENTLPRLIAGLSILALGIIFWLDRSGTIDAVDYLRWWPVAAIAMGIAHLLQRRWFGAAVWIVPGLVFLMPLLGLSRSYAWRVIGLWPLLISVGGVMLILQALRGAGRERSFNAVAIMGGNVRKVGGRLVGGDAVAVMGGCEIDLSAARIADEAVIDVLAFWGGIELRVPRGWKVVSHVAEILGGYDDKTVGAPDDAPRLVIRGSAIMGGIEVKHPAEIAG